MTHIQEVTGSKPVCPTTVKSTGLTISSNPFFCHSSKIFLKNYFAKVVPTNFSAILSNIIQDNFSDITHLVLSLTRQLFFHEPFSLIREQTNFLPQDSNRLAHAQTATFQRWGQAHIRHPVDLVLSLTAIFRFASWGSGTFLRKWLASARTNPHPPDRLDLHCGYFSRRSFNRSKIWRLFKFSTMSAISLSRARTNPQSKSETPCLRIEIFIVLLGRSCSRSLG